MRFSLILVALSAACTGDDTDDTEIDTEVDSEVDTEVDTEGDTDPVSDGDVYAFQSRNGVDSSVSYGGQVSRHVFISDMKDEIGSLTDRIDNGSYTPIAGDVTADMNFYFEFDVAVGGSVPHGIATTPAPVQTTYSDLTAGSDIVGKLAGNDATGQHEDWTTALVGWDQDGVTTPESLVRLWIGQLDALAADRAAGTIPTWPDGSPIGQVYITQDGQDLQQLIQKFLLGAVTYSQGTDDYLDDDIDGKGLLSDNTELVDGKPYTALEHVWDEGFGYFGATRQFADLTDDDIADIGHFDHNEDGAIDLQSEFVFGHAQNAAKRDLGAVVATDYTQQAWDAFFAGRTLIHDAGGALTDTQLDELRGHRDDALDAWERAIASTAVHYINDTLRDMGTMGTADYDAATHAKHWAELKGFAMSLQFSPHSQVSDADFETLQDLIGTAPALTMDEVADASTDLLAARNILATSYSFEAGNMGNDEGENGW